MTSNSISDSRGQQILIRKQHPLHKPRASGPDTRGFVDPLIAVHEILESIAAGEISGHAPELPPLSNKKLLSETEAQQLAQHYISFGSVDARNVLIVKNQGLVHSVAVKFVGRGIEMNDLVQAGNLGLSRAVETFNPQAKNKFSTYAVWWIRSSIQRMLERKDHQESTNIWGGGTRRYRGVTKSVTAPIVSLNTVMSSDDLEGETFQDSMPADSDVEKEVVSKQIQDDVRAALKEIVAEQSHIRSIKEIVKLRMLSDSPMTLKGVGEAVGTSDEWVRQVENRVRAFLKQKLAAKYG